ncbi:phosphoesterase [Bosea sp. BIWAKO-01]|nr:phosphoesterase [Bosea sp. BIWAKO-01]
MAKSRGSWVRSVAPHRNRATLWPGFAIRLGKPSELTLIVLRSANGPVPAAVPADSEDACEARRVTPD